MISRPHTVRYPLHALLAVVAAGLLFVFDLVVGAATLARHVPPGTYTLTASFGGAALTRPGVQIGP